MRIRHGSLSGHLRGPLEEKNLIVSKNEAGEGHRSNTILADRLHLAADRSAFFAAFTQFSSQYDAIIADLTKNLLQIRSAKKPQGVFSLDLQRNPVILHFVRARITEKTSFNDFLITAITAITLALRAILLEVRHYIKTTVKHEVEPAFET